LLQKSTDCPHSPIQVNRSHNKPVRARFLQTNPEQTFGWMGLKRVERTSERTN
jgi:hypothetical protein